MKKILSLVLALSLMVTATACGGKSASTSQSQGNPGGQSASSAGSTAGGIKVVRVGILCKLGCREVRRTFQPRKVQVVRFEGKGVEENRLTQVSAFFFVYVLLVLAGMFLVSLEGLYDLETNFTAVLTCISNVGPGLGHVGPVENFSGYGPFAKVVLSLLMLAGRLELFPILVLFHPLAWRKG